MRRKRIATIMVIGILLAWSTPGESANALILNVPDINQPDHYAGLAAPPPGLAVGDYPGWCSPTSGAMLMGYWEDVKGCTGLTDRQVFAASPAYPNPPNPATEKQGLWHDGTVEMGWHMDIGGWKTAAGPFPPKAGMTNLGMIGPGLLSYATTGWVDPGSGITKVNFGNPPWNMTALDIGKDIPPVAAPVWTNYVAEIDAGRPVLSSFQNWVTPAPTGPTHTVNGQTVYEYAFAAGGEGHTVCAVGYLDLTAGFQNNGLDEWIIAQDNWSNTFQYVAVPFNTLWQQNDYVYDIPEPFTLTLLVLGSAGLFLRRKRQVKIKEYEK